MNLPGWISRSLGYSHATSSRPGVWIARILPYLTGFWIAVLLLVPFDTYSQFFSGPPAPRGGDYWCIPRGILNLLSGHSMYEMYGNQFGGGLIFLYMGHPAFELLVAPWFAFFPPATSAWLWSATSVALLLWVGWLFSLRAQNELTKSLCIFSSIFGFPMLLLAHSGNMHSWPAAALGLAIIGVFEMSLVEGSRVGRSLLFAGLMISLLSKPVLLLALPALLLTSDTRKITLIAIAIYVAISLICLLVPALNPEGIGLRRIVELLFDPTYVREHMNIYKNHFAQTPEMKDNSIHWFNLLAQSDFYWDYIQIYSFPAFVNNMVGKELPGVIYKIPLVFAVLLSIVAVRVCSRSRQLKAAMWSVVLLSLSYFLSYTMVWEYQFIAIIPLTLLGIILLDRGLDRGIARILVICGIIVAGPSLYFVFGSSITVENYKWMRLTRVLPVTVLYVTVAWQLCRESLHGMPGSGVSPAR